MNALAILRYGIVTLVMMIAIAACATPENEGAADAADADAADSAGAEAGQVVIGQPVSSLGYLSIDAARAFDTFSDVGLELDLAMISGGDTTLLAALSAGDIHLAAPGSSAALQTISLGEEFQIVYSLMSRMSIDLTVSDAFLESRGVTPDDPLEDRLAALEGITIGVSGLGGAQDRIAQWLGEYADLGSGGVETVNIGPPPAARAAMEEGAIDGFVLTAPNGQIAEEQGFGQRFIRLGSEIEGLDQFHHTVLVVHKPFAEEQRDLVTDTVAALSTAASRATEDPKALAQELHEGEFSEVSYEIIEEAVTDLVSGIENQGRMTPDSIDFTVQFAQETGYPLEQELDAASGEGDWWTNEYVDAAQAGDSEG